MFQWLRRLWNLFQRLFRGERSATQRPQIPLPPANTVNLPVSIPKPLTEAKLKLEAAVSPEYRKTNSLLTFQERKFYRTVLLRQLSSRYAIFLKVRLGDLVWISNEPSDRKFHNNQLLCKHIDFVLCDRSTLAPVLAIELDDSSHSKYDRRESDAVKDRVCEQAKLPLLRVKVQHKYSAEAIAEEVHNRLRGQ
jgi:hypothetical protein